MTFPVSFTVASPADPFTPTRPIGVLGVIGVSLRAVSNRSHTGSYGFSSDSSSRVYFMSDGFEMLRIDAAPYAAQMVQFEAGSNRATRQFIRNAVGALRLVFNFNVSVAAWIKATHPYPTSTLGNRHGIQHHGFDVSPMRDNRKRRTVAERLQSDAFRACVSLNKPLRCMSASALNSVEEEPCVLSERLSARDNRAVIRNVLESHAIGSFDQVVRGRAAVRRFTVPLYTN